MSDQIIIATIMRPIGDTGVQTHFKVFSNWLQANHISTRLITPFDSPKWKVYPTFALRRVIDLFSGTASVWWYRHWHAKFLFDALKKILADASPCVIYAQCPLSADAAIKARSSTKQRVVMVTHFNESQADEWAGKGLISAEGGLYQSIRHFEAITLPGLDGIVYVSDYMRQKLTERIHALKDMPYRVIPNFISDPGNRQQHSGFLADLICIGTLEPRKNQRYALEIVAAAKRLGSPLKLTVVGDGPDRAELERAARELNVESDVMFMGYVNNAASLFDQHRACLHVAQTESFGIVLIEAMSRSLPVFAPAVGGIPEIFDDGIEGRAIPPDNAYEAAISILEWLSSDNLLKMAGAAAKARFLDKFETSAVAENLTNFLDSLTRQES